MNIPLSNLRVDDHLMLVAGLAVSALGVALSLLPAVAGMAVASGLAVLFPAFVLGYRPIQAGDITRHLGSPPRIWKADGDWGERHARADPVSGWSNEPGAIARRVGPNISVTYRIDAEGWRRLPSPPPHTAAGEIWFVGCSFTFGADVEDEEVYVHQLAAKAWPSFRLRNFSVSGWGTTNALLVLKDKLAREPPPRAVFYGFISHHRKRNYLRRSWFEPSRASLIPLFELDGERARWVGLVPGSTATVEDGPQLDAIEVRLTVALIREMARLSAERGAAFVLLALSYGEETVLAELRGTRGLHILDVSRASRSYLPNGGHPTPVWHQMVARAIASSPLPAELTGIAALHAPDAIPAPTMGSWGLSYAKDYKGAAIAAVSYPTAPEQPLRVSFRGDVSGDPHDFRLARHYPPIVKGRVYSLEIELRSTAARPLRFLLDEGRAPWAHTGLEGAIELTGDWRHIRRVFVAARNAQDPLLTLLLGESNRAVEVAREPVLRELASAEAEAALAALARPRWQLSAQQPAEAVLDHDSADAGPPLRVRIKRLGNRDPWSVQLQHDGAALKAGREYSLELRVRAAGTRPIQYAISLDHAPWENLGLWGEVTLTPRWQTVRRTFYATRDGERTRLVLALGGHAETVEVADARLLPRE